MPRLLKNRKNKIMFELKDNLVSALPDIEVQYVTALDTAALYFINTDTGSKSAYTMYLFTDLDLP